MCKELCATEATLNSPTINTVGDLIKALQWKDPDQEIEYIIVSTIGELVAVNTTGETAALLINVLKNFKDC